MTPHFLQPCVSVQVLHSKINSLLLPLWIFISLKFIKSRKHEKPPFQSHSLCFFLSFWLAIHLQVPNEGFWMVRKNFRKSFDIWTNHRCRLFSFLSKGDHCHRVVPCWCRCRWLALSAAARTNSIGECFLPILRSPSKPAKHFLSGNFPIKTFPFWHFSSLGKFSCQDFISWKFPF